MELLEVIGCESTATRKTAHGDGVRRSFQIEDVSESYRDIYSEFVLVLLAVTLVACVLFPGRLMAQVQSNDFPATFRYRFVVPTDQRQSSNPDGTLSIVVKLYSSETATYADWQEVFTVPPDSNGNVTVEIGSTSPQKLPAELFTSNGILWVGVQIGNAAELPRTSLRAVPYALKSRDTESLGGLPASVFISALGPASGSTAASSSAGTSTGKASSNTSSQPGTTSTIRHGVILPASCTHNSGQAFFVDSDGFYICSTSVDNAWIRLAGLSQANTWTAAQTGPFNSVLNASQYVSSSSTCGIAESYAAGAGNGVSIILGADCTISTPQTITTIVQKPLYLNGQGHVITCTNTSGVCLTLIKPDSTPRTSVIISSLKIVHSGSGASVTGFKIGSQAAPATDVVLRDVEVSNFNTSGAVALELDNAEDVHAYSTKLNGNTLAVKCDKNSNNNQFFDTAIQGGSQAVSLTDASGNNFIGGLIQSNTAPRTITQTSSTISISGNTFENVWIENNGNGTASSRVFYNSANGARHAIAGFASLKNTINSGPYGAGGAGGKVYEFAGDGAAVTVAPILKGNTYGGYGGANVITGTLVFPISVEGEPATYADVGINLNGMTGLHFWPQAGSHHYRIFAGDSAQMGGNNNFFIKDLTAGTTPLTYTSSTQTWSAANFSAATSMTIGSNAVPVVASPMVGQATCIKAAGPPVVIGYCSTAVGSGGACTCN